MAWYPTNMGGSGTLQETVLWTNPSPTSAISGVTITLSDDMDNYDYLKVKISASKDTSTEPLSIISYLVPVEDVKKSVYGSSAQPHSIIGLVASSASSTYYCSRLTYTDNTTLGISGARNIVSGATSNNFCIPLEISGVTIN